MRVATNILGDTIHTLVCMHLYGNEFDLSPLLLPINCAVGHDQVSQLYNSQKPYIKLFPKDQVTHADS